MRILRKIKYILIKLSRARDTEHEIAYGAAIGAFISIFPTFGASTVLVVFLYKFMRFNLLAAVASSMISNFFTAPFFLFLSYKLGSIWFKPESDLNLKTWYKHLDDIGIAVLVGGLILSFIVSGLLYLVVKYWVMYYRNKKKKLQTIEAESQ